MTNRKHYLHTVISLNESGRRANRVTPKEFLSWAKRDLKSQDKRALGNAVSNIKRAFHARLDELIDRTHLRFTHDWKPYTIATDEKLRIVRKLGVQHDAVVGPITEIRNKYEHDYIIPPLSTIKAYLSTCELWLDNTYETHDFHALAIVGLPIVQLSWKEPKANGSVISTTRFDTPTEVRYFWNSKQTLVTVKKNGDIEEKKFSDYSCKEMLSLEAPLIKKSYTSTSSFACNQASLTDIFRRYRRWLKEQVAESAGSNT